MPLPRVELFGLITVIAVAETRARVHSEWETLKLGSNFRSSWLRMEHAGVSKSRAAGWCWHVRVGRGSVTVPSMPAHSYSLCSLVITGSDFPSAEALWFPALLLDWRDKEQPCSGRCRPASQLVAELLA